MVATAPEYDKRRIRASQNNRYRRTAVYEKHSEARKTDVVYRRVFKEQDKWRSIQVSINVDEYRSIVRTACWYCGGVDRVQNAGENQKDNVVASCKTCNFMK
ncbi:unnamed protein product, partial [Scytosiphon promiscuus]